MLSQLDNIIFPDRCDVLEIVPSQRYIYPIFKNASSSLMNSGFRLLSQDELSRIDNVEVLVRNPYDRFLSGVQTYLDKLDPSLDQDTALHFVENHLFLNRHFVPQFHWLVNLQRYTKATITLRPLHYVETLTDVKINQSIHDIELAERFAENSKVHFYLEIDKVLINNLMGKTVTFKDIVETIRSEYPSVYKEVIQRSIDICTVLD